jgi:hypothetical protein
MKFRKPLLFFVIATVASLAICQLWERASYEEKLIRIQVEQEVAYIDKAIMNEPVEVQLMLLDYSRDKELTLKAWIALSKYPEKAREILSLYGSEPEFKEILINYGESIIPPIQYFQENDVWSVKAISSIADGIEITKEAAKSLWNGITGNEQTSSNSTTQAQTAEFGPEQRGWYAVNFIKQEGHHFLGQFVVDKDKKVKWVQTERILEGVTSFFASGLRTLETKYDLGDEITTGDVFWAGVDVAVVAGSLKLLRAGKAVARSGKELSFVSRTRIFASRLLSEGKIFQKLGKYGAEAATAYIIVAHPSLINSAFAEAAKMMGLNPWLIRFAGWSLIITIALYPFSWLLKIFARIVLSVFSWIEQSRKKPIPNIASADSAAS